MLLRKSAKRLPSSESTHCRFVLNQADAVIDLMPALVEVRERKTVELKQNRFVIVPAPVGIEA